MDTSQYWNCVGGVGYWAGLGLRGAVGYLLWLELSVVAMPVLDTAAVFTGTGAGLGLGDVVILAEELGVVVVVLAEELVEDMESGDTLFEPS